MATPHIERPYAISKNIAPRAMIALSGLLFGSILAAIPCGAQRDRHGKLVLDTFEVAVKWTSRRRSADRDATRRAFNNRQGIFCWHTGRGAEACGQAHGVRVWLGHAASRSVSKPLVHSLPAWPIAGCQLSIAKRLFPRGKGLLLGLRHLRMHRHNAFSCQKYRVRFWVRLVCLHFQP